MNTARNPQSTPTSGACPSPIQDKVILVTGGARGLGEAICRNLGQAGAKVVITDIRQDQARRVSESIRGAGGTSMPIQLDVTNESHVRDAVARTVAELGSMDILINNAGVDLTVPIEEMTSENWDRIIGTNLRGPFVLSKEVLPYMRKQGRGHILNIVSTAAKRAWANASAYHASKWGLLGFSHALHVEARPHNVKVTALVCGGMRTPFLLERFPDINLETLQDPMDVAETIKFVLSAPQGTVIPEVMAIPMRETSWP